MKTAHRSEKGAIAPLLMVVMIIGLVFGVYLIQQRTNLFSKANYVSSPINPSQLRVTCSSDSEGHYRAQFNWPAINVVGKTVQNYTLRVNKEPGGVWAPDPVLDCRGQGCPNEVKQGDFAAQLGTSTSITGIRLSAGRYAGWDITPGFVGETREASQYKTFGPAFTCGSSGGGGGAGGG